VTALAAIAAAVDRLAAAIEDGGPETPPSLRPVVQPHPRDVEQPAPPTSDSKLALAELVARAAEDAKPPGFPYCSGSDAYGRQHDPACILA
jgi:hypothetical protein